MSWTSKWRIRTVRRPDFADDGEGLDQDVVEAGALGQLFLEFGGFGAELGVGEGLDPGFELVDGGDEGLELFQVALVLRPEDFGDQPLDHFLFIIRNLPPCQFGGRSSPPGETRQSRSPSRVEALGSKTAFGEG